MIPKIVKYANSDEALRAMTHRLVSYLLQKKDDSPFTLALSGGGTAKQMFRLWVNEYADTVDWQRFRFFWVDERCVSPTDEESNYGQAYRLFFEPMKIPVSNVFRIHGETDPEDEAVRYSSLVGEQVPANGSYPCFDAVILGIGNDGHTASIFPNLLPLLADSRNYVVSRHPVTNQYRISMSGTLILNSSHLLIPVLGIEKADLLSRLMDSTYLENGLPAAYILEHASDAVVFS